MAARSVVVSDVDPYTIVGGNPAKPIRKRFNQETIDLLQTTQWWNWSSEKITRHLEILSSNDESKLKEVKCLEE